MYCHPLPCTLWSSRLQLCLQLTLSGIEQITHSPQLTMFFWHWRFCVLGLSPNLRKTRTVTLCGYFSKSWYPTPSSPGKLHQNLWGWGPRHKWGKISSWFQCTTNHEKVLLEGRVPQLECAQESPGDHGKNAEFNSGLAGAQFSAVLTSSLLILVLLGNEPPSKWQRSDRHE